MRVTICGIPYTVETVPVIDEASEGIVQGEIHYSKAEIIIKSSLPSQLKEEVIIHEMVHGILHHIGETELRDNEDFVQRLTNGIYNSSLCLLKEEEQ
jgi:hypothetical protein